MLTPYPLFCRIVQPSSDTPEKLEWEKDGAGRFRLDEEGKRIPVLDETTQLQRKVKKEDKSYMREETKREQRSNNKEESSQT